MQAKNTHRLTTISVLIIAVLFLLPAAITLGAPANPNGYLPVVIKQPTHTFTPEATASATPTFTPTPEVTATPTAEPPKGVVVLSSNAFVPYEGSDYVYIVGEVLNNTNSNVQFVRINVTLRDASGNVVGLDYSYAKIDILPPNTKSPFLVIFFDPLPWETYETAVTWDKTSQPAYFLEILSHTPYFDSLDAYHVVGEVKNPYTHALQFVKVLLTVYDANGQVIGVDYVYTDPTTLSPGQAVAFDVSAYFWKYKPDRSKIHSYSIQAVGDK